MRINEMITQEKNNALVFYQILLTHSLRKCMETSLRICMWILGLKGLTLEAPI